MNKRNKILLRVAIIILIITLITALVLSSVYAKYVTDQPSPSAVSRPAAFDIVMKSPMQDEIEVNFAADGEPGAPIGHTEVEKAYEFSVVTDSSEVASEYSLELIFSAKVADKIRAARADKFADGLLCDYKIYQGEEVSENEIVYSPDPLVGIEMGLDREGQPMTWSCVEDLAPYTNPGNKTGKTCYKLVVTFYNNTMMTSKVVNGATVYNYDDFLFASNGIEIKVTSKQVNPEFKGNHIFS